MMMLVVVVVVVVAAAAAKGVSSIFHWRQDRRATAGVMFLGRGNNPLPTS